MKSRRKPGFAARPGSPAVGSPDDWVRTSDRQCRIADIYTARLTIDVTPVLRGRIKITAFARGQTVAEMLRGMLEREFPSDVERQP